MAELPSALWQEAQLWLLAGVALKIVSPLAGSGLAGLAAPRGRLGSGSSAAKLALAAARQQGCKQKGGKRLHIGGLDLWRKTPRFYNGAPFRKPIDDHPAAQAGRASPAAPASTPQPPNAPAWRWAGCTPRTSSPARRSSNTCPPSSCRRSPSSAAPTPASRPPSTRSRSRRAWPSPPRRPGARSTSTCSASASRRSTTPCWPTCPATATRPCRSEAKLRWQRVMGNYLMTRANLRGVVLMCDPRHGLTELDDILLDVIRPRVEQGLKFLVLLTKADKLTRSRRRQGAVDCATAGRRRRGQTVLGPEAAGRRRGGRTAVALGAPAGRAARGTDAKETAAMIETFAARAAQRHHAQLPRRRRARPPADGVPARLSGGRLHLGRAARALRAARARRLPLRGAEPARLRAIQLAGRGRRPTAPHLLVQDIAQLAASESADGRIDALVAHDWGGAFGWGLANQHPRQARPAGHHQFAASRHLPARAAEQPGAAGGQRLHELPAPARRRGAAVAPTTTSACGPSSR